MLISAARRLCRIVAAMIAPCSVKASGETLGLRCLWEPLGIALDGLVECLGGHAVEGSELGIEQDSVAAQDEDGAGNGLDGHESLAVAGHALARLGPAPF
jgi:hypothetical protein